MAIDFPANPSAGDIHTDNGVDYRFDGVKWKLFSKQYSYNGTELVNTLNQTEIDLSTGNFFDLSLSESTTVSFVNPPVGTAQKFQIKFSLASDFTQSDSSWDIENASYDNVSFALDDLNGNPYDITFKPDGTRMYITDLVNQAVFSYALSTAWDISTADLLSSFEPPQTGQNYTPYSVYFRPDGMRMYVSQDEVFQYTLSTAWDLSTASYDNVSFRFDVNQEEEPASIFLRPDGTQMYTIGATSDSVHQYSLSTAWDIGTASYDGVSFSVASEDTLPSGIHFRSDGTRMFIVGRNSDSVHQYSLSTAWDLSTASYVNVEFSVASEDLAPVGIHFRPDGTSMFMVGIQNDRVHQYSTSVILPTVTWPTSITWESGNAPTLPELGETDLLEFYTSDGGTTYYAKLIEDDIS